MNDTDTKTIDNPIDAIEEDEENYACGTCGGNCWGCMYADLCDVWLDTGTTPYIIPDD